MLPKEDREDRRIQKTKHLLRQSLAALISEKNYAAIAVKEILLRANIGRSAFYSHFRDKDELLAYGIHEMLRSAYTSRQSRLTDRSEKLLWFSLPIFEYHYSHHLKARTFTGNNHLLPDSAHAYLKNHLTGLIAIDVNQAYEKRGSVTRNTPAEIVVEHIASTFILILNWWIEHRMSPPPAEVDRLYQNLLLPGLKDIFDN